MELKEIQEKASHYYASLKWPLSNSREDLIKTAFVTGYAESILDSTRVAKEAEKWMMEAERLKSDLLHRDINVLPEKDAEIERLIIDLKAHKEVISKQEKEIRTLSHKFAELSRKASLPKECLGSDLCGVDGACFSQISGKGFCNKDDM